jgi:hypothetical protein
MTDPTPYDHTTPPPSPQTNSQSRTPQLSCAVTRPQATVKSHQTAPAAAYTPPCEGRTVARDGFYYPLRRSSSFPSSQTSSHTTQHLIPKENPHKDTDFSLTPLAGRPQPSRDETARGKPQLSLLERFLMDTVPQVSHLTQVHVPDEMATDGKPKKKKKLPAVWTSKLRQPRRPSEIFNINFSFSASSRRGPSDHTPQISPRTSISSDSGSPTSTSEDSFKRQRVDSSDSSSMTLKPFTTNSPRSDGWCPGPSPSPNGAPGSWFPEHIKSFCPVATSADPHPGFLVDFASSSSDEARRKKDEQGYHDYLNEERRHLNSSPDENRIFYMDMDVEDDIPPAYREDVTKQARILGLSGNATNIKRASTVHIDTRKCGAQSGSSSSGSGSYRTRTSSTMSDPSTDKFLTHVRASQEARKLARTLSEGKKGVYANDDMKIWLGNDPL